MKKFISILCVFVLVITIGAFGVSAVDTNEPKIILERVEAKSGEAVSIKVMIENNPGLWGMDLKISYDKTVMTLTGVENGDFFSDSEWTKGNLNSDTYILSYEANTLDDITTASGVLATLNFTINEAVQPGDYEVKAAYKAGDIINISFDDIDFAITNGNVKVKEEAPYTSHIVSITDGVADAGDAAKITVVTDLSVTKVQFVAENGSTITLNKRVIKGNQKIWTLEKAYKKGVYSYGIKEKVDETWYDSGKTATLTFNTKVLKSGTAVSAEYDATSGLYKVTIKGEAIKLQFITPDGLTRTYHKSHDAVKSVSFNGDGTEVWLVDAKLSTGVKYTVAGKFESGWNYTDTASVIAK